MYKACLKKTDVLFYASVKIPMIFLKNIYFKSFMIYLTFWVKECLILYKKEIFL